MDQLVDSELNKRILNVIGYKAAYYYGWEAGIGYSLMMKASQQTDTPSTLDIEVRPQVELQQLMERVQDKAYVIQWNSPFYDSEPFRIGCIDSAAYVFQGLLRHQEQLAHSSYTPDDSLLSFSQTIVNDQCVIGGKAKGLMDAIKLNADVANIHNEVEWRKKFLQSVAQIKYYMMFTSGRVEGLIESLDLITQVKQGKTIPELDISQANNIFDQ